MSIVKRIVEPDQTVVVVAEDEYVAVMLFFEDGCAENLDDPDDVVLLGVEGAGRLATALVEAVERTRAAA